MKRISLLCLLLLTAGLVSAPAVSRFVEGGGNAFGVLGGFSRSEGATGIEAGIGFSIGGNIDLNAGFGKGYADEGFDEEDLSVNVFMLGAAFFPIKQSADIPVSLSVSADIAFGNYVSDALNYYGWDMTQTTIGFGFAVYHTVRVSETFSVQPSFGAGYSSTKLKIEDSFGGSLTEKDSGIAFGVDAAMIFQTSETGKFFLKPGVNVDEDVVAFGLDAGYVLRF